MGNFERGVKKRYQTKAAQVKYTKLVRQGMNKLSQAAKIRKKADAPIQ